MNGGINQLVDTYKGNPQPLQAKVQKAQQGQPPGEIPPDLEEAMALQKIAELRNSAQGQQAMQAGGAQQSVVEKLRQMLGGMQAQGQMQGQPVMAARGGSIDQLMSNLGQYYAGGGIVAFDGTKGSEVEDKKAKQREEDRRALLEPLAAVVDIAQLPIAAGYNLAADTGSGLERFLNRIGSALTGKEVNTQSDDQVGNKFRFSPTPFTDMLRKPTERETPSEAPTVQSSKPGTTYEKPGNIAAPTVNNMYTDKDGKTFVRPVGMSDESWKKLVANARTEQIPTSQGAGDRIVPRYPISAPQPPAPAPKPPRPPAANVNAPAKPAEPAKPASEAMDPMETALRKSIMDALAKDPEAVRKKAMEQNAQFMGLDALLKPAQDRAAAREARIKEIQGSRQPLWIDALMSAGKPTKGGIAGVLQNMAVGAISGKQNYDAEDLKFLDELNKLNSEIDKARIEGRYKDVAAGKEAVKDLISEKKQSEASGTSLLNKQATLAQTRQIAEDNRKSREALAAAQAEGKKSERQQRQQNWIAEQERKWQDTLSRNPEYKKLIDQRSFQERLLYMPNIDPKAQEKAQAAVDAINEKIAKMLPTAGGGTVNIPPPPPGAVRETVKKS
jgi:hypothetical protein